MQTFERSFRPLRTLRFENVCGEETSKRQGLPDRWQTLQTIYIDSSHVRSIRMCKCMCMHA